jgi:hypothetical protein
MSEQGDEPQAEVFLTRVPKISDMTNAELLAWAQKLHARLVSKMKPAEIETKKETNE